MKRRSVQCNPSKRNFQFQFCSLRLSAVHVNQVSPSGLNESLNLLLGESSGRGNTGREEAALDAIRIVYGGRYVLFLLT